MSTLFVNNLNTASGSTITIPTGKKLVGTDSASIYAPGMVVQVVTSETTTQIAGTAGASEVALGFTGAITPKFSSSKIYVAVNLQAAVTGVMSNYAMGLKVRRGTSASDALILEARFGHYANQTNVNRELFSTIAFADLDSPNTTSAVTYGTFAINIDQNPNYKISGNSGKSTITLMEIAQ